jgi:hypothetical protein
MSAGFEGTTETAVQDKSKGRFLDELLDKLARQGNVYGTIKFDPNGNEIRLISFEDLTHPPVEYGPPDHFGHDIPPRPEEGDDFNLPSWPAHIYYPGWERFFL